MQSGIYIVEAHNPVVNDDLGVNPGVVLVEEEGHGEGVLAVQVLLQGHVVVGHGAAQLQVADERDGEDSVAVVTTGDGKTGIGIGHEASYGHFGDAHVQHSFFTGAFYVCRASLLVVGKVCQRAVGRVERVVVAHESVAVGHGDFKERRVHRFPRHLLEDDAERMSVAGQGHGEVFRTAGGAGHGLRGQVAVPQGLQTIVHSLHWAVAEQLFFAVDAAVKVVDGGLAFDQRGDGESLALEQTGPSDQVVLSGIYVEHHAISVAGQCFALLAALEDQAAVIIESVECDGVYLCGKGVGVEHVVIVLELYPILGAAVFVVPDGFTRRKPRQEHRKQYERAGRVEYGAKQSHK